MNNNKGIHYHTVGTRLIFLNRVGAVNYASEADAGITNKLLGSPVKWESSPEEVRRLAILHSLPNQDDVALANIWEEEFGVELDDLETAAWLDTVPDGPDVA